MKYTASIRPMPRPDAPAVFFCAGKSELKMHISKMRVKQKPNRLGGLNRSVKSRQ